MVSNRTDSPHYCQGEQERWIRQIFGSDVGYAIDVGANDGAFFSNTLAAEQLGWTVLCVEANPGYEILLRNNRKLVEMCAAGETCSENVPFFVNDQYPASRSGLVNDGSFREIRVTMMTLDRLVARYRFPRVDLLSIDTEGSELRVLKGFDLEFWNPKAVFVEAIGPASAAEQAVNLHLIRFGYALSDRSNEDCLFQPHGS